MNDIDKLRVVYPTPEALHTKQDPSLSDEDKLDIFDLQFVPDAWQWDLIRIVRKRESVLVCAPTSAGKTFISL